MNLVDRFTRDRVGRFVWAALAAIFLVAFLVSRQQENRVQWVFGVLCLGAMGMLALSLRRPPRGIGADRGTRRTAVATVERFADESASSGANAPAGGETLADRVIRAERRARDAEALAARLQDQQAESELRARDAEASAATGTAEAALAAAAEELEHVRRSLAEERELRRRADEDARFHRERADRASAEMEQLREAQPAEPLIDKATMAKIEERLSAAERRADQAEQRGRDLEELLTAAQVQAAEVTESGDGPGQPEAPEPAPAGAVAAGAAAAGRREEGGRSVDGGGGAATPADDLRARLARSAALKKRAREDSDAE